MAKYGWGWYVDVGSEIVTTTHHQVMSGSKFGLAHTHFSHPDWVSLDWFGQFGNSQHLNPSNLSPLVYQMVRHKTQGWDRNSSSKTIITSWLLSHRWWMFRLDQVPTFHTKIACVQTDSAISYQYISLILPVLHIIAAVFGISQHMISRCRGHWSCSGCSMVLKGEWWSLALLEDTLSAALSQLELGMHCALNASIGHPEILVRAWFNCCVRYNRITI